jgi:hypothetical protein
MAMKQFTYRLALVAALLATGTVPVEQSLGAEPPTPSKIVAQAQLPESQAPVHSIAVPQAEVLLVLIRSALIALDHANKTGNYSVLRELGGPALQTHSSGQLANLFANLRNQNVDLLATAVITPQLTKQPMISGQGQLILAGVFPTKPQSVAFDIVYQPVQGQWRLFGMNVAVTAAPAESAPAVTPPPAAGQPDPTLAKTPSPTPKKAQPAPDGKTPAR